MNTLISLLGEKLSASQEELSSLELVKICHLTFAVDGLAFALSSVGHRFKTRPETCHRYRCIVGVTWLVQSDAGVVPSAGPRPLPCAS
jgi:hypothetical protein